jgi:orotate phosphoribosyltransferase
MEDHQREFLLYLHSRDALRFGEFKTKSGRLSPYFFNAGGLCLGSDLIRLGQAYADAIESSYGDGVDLIYGPAYKGIPLAVLAAAELSRRYGREVAYCCNRKEVKDHGEKGMFLGKVPESGDRIVLVDDVITAGTSVRETMELFKTLEGTKPVGLIVSLDRQEKGLESDMSAVQEIERDFGFPVHAAGTVEQVIELLKEGVFEGVGDEILEKALAYREAYGV